MHQLTMDILHGRFELAHRAGWWFDSSPLDGKGDDDPDIEWMDATKRHDQRLRNMDRYRLRTPTKNPNGPTVFKLISTEGNEHSPNGATSCSFAMTLELTLEDDERYREGGLHYVGCATGGYFVQMMLNYRSYGTILPFTPNCHCGTTTIPPKWAALAAKWDSIIRRALADEYDIQCMFADVPLKCHTAGRGCPFKHDIPAKKK